RNEDFCMAHFRVRLIFTEEFLNGAKFLPQTGAICKNATYNEGCPLGVIFEFFKDTVLRIHVAYVDVGAAVITASLHQRAKNPFQKLVTELSVLRSFSLLHVIHDDNVRSLVFTVDTTDCSSRTDGP